MKRSPSLQSPGTSRGLLLLFHASVDCAFGYGLEHLDSFPNTHLGTIGKAGPKGKPGTGRCGALVEVAAGVDFLDCRFERLDL